jgi:hypothetical protein
MARLATSCLPKKIIGNRLDKKAEEFKRSIEN